MPLSAAMALSGLNEEQFGSELSTLYKHGARLLQPVDSNFNNRCIGMTTGEENQPEGAIALPIAANAPSGPGPSAALAPLPNGEIGQDYWQFLARLDNIEFGQLMPEHLRYCPQHRNDSDWPPPPPNPSAFKISLQALSKAQSKIPNKKRDILDLGSNIKPFNAGFQQAIIPPLQMASHDFVRQNQSQYSRLLNEFTLPDEIETCAECYFEVPHYEDNNSRSTSNN